MTEKKCFGACFELTSDLYKKNNSCTENCQLQPCLSCGEKYPQEILDSVGSLCLSCKIKRYEIEKNTNEEIDVDQLGNLCERCFKKLVQIEDDISNQKDHLGNIRSMHKKCWIEWKELEK
jgi:hypothetical protein